MAFHAMLTPVDLSNASDIKFSVFVKNGMLIPAVILWELLAFGMLAFVFVLIQNSLYGKKWMKGLVYGLSFGGLYFIGMFEAVLLLNSSVLSEFLMGMTDCISFVISGVMLGIFCGTDSMQSCKKRNISVTLIVGFFYIVGRYLAYTVVNIQSANSINPLGTFFWTTSLGLWIGNIYFMLQSGAKGKSIILQSLFFGIIIFGSNWLINHIFMYIVIEFTYDLLIRSGIDIVFIIMGVYTCRKLFNKSVDQDLNIPHTPL